MKKAISILLALALVTSLLLPSAVMGISAEASPNLLTDANLSIKNGYLTENNDGTVSNTVPDFDSAVYSDLNIEKGGAYRYEVKVTIDEENTNGDLAPVVAFRGDSITSAYVLQFWKNGVSVISLNGTNIGAISGYDYFQSLTREVGHTYDVVIESYYDKAKIIIDGVPYFSSKADSDGCIALPQKPALFGFAERWCATTFEPVSLTAIDYDNPYVIPSIPAYNYEYTESMTLTGSLAVNNSYFYSEAASWNDFSYVGTPISGSDSFVYRTTVLPNANCNDRIQLIFRGSGNTDYLALALYKNGVGLQKRSGWNDTALDGTWNTSFHYTVNVPMDVAILSKPGFVSVWIDGSPVFINFAVESKSALMGINYTNGAGKITPTAVYRTTSEGNYPVPAIPENNNNYVNMMKLSGSLAQGNCFYSAQTVSGDCRSFASVPFSNTDSYVYRATVLPDATNCDWIHLIYRSGYAIAFAAGGVGIQSLPASYSFSACSDVWNSAYGYKKGVAMDVAIWSEPGYVSLWVNDKCVFYRQSVPEAAAAVGASFSGGCGTITPTAIYRTTAENNPVIPAVPEGNLDYGTMPLSGALAQEEGYFYSETLASGVQSFVNTPVAGSESFVYKTTVLPELSNSDMIQLIFRGSDANSYLALCMFQGGVNLCRQSGFNTTAIDDSYWRAGMGYTVGTALNGTILSEPGFVTIWLNDVCVYNRVAVPEMDALIGVNYNNAAGSVIPTEIYRTVSENNEVCPEFSDSYTNLATTTSIVSAGDETYFPIALSKELSRSQKLLINYDVVLNEETLTETQGPTLVFRSTVDPAGDVAEYLMLHMRNGYWVMTLNHNYLDWQIAAYGSAIFKREIGTTYNVTIASGDGKASVWVDDVPVIMNAAVANEDVAMGVQFFGSDAQISNIKVAEVSEEVGHSTQGDWIVSVEPTTTTYGSRYKVCTICNENVTERIAKLSAATGDVNGDGDIDIRDIVRLKRYFCDKTTAINEVAADLTGNTKIETDDIVSLRKHLLGVNP